MLLSDEATSALDPETTAVILQLLKEIRDQLNLTILLITHEMSVIKACCDRVAILDEGKLIEENEVGKFFSAPQTAIAKSLSFLLYRKHYPQRLLKKFQLNTLHSHIWFYASGSSMMLPLSRLLPN